MATWCPNSELVKTATELKSKVIAFSANSTIDSYGCLVMGAGAAKSVRDLFPDSPDKFGAVISQDVSVVTEDYHLAEIVIKDMTLLAYQVKRDWKDFTPLMDLTRRSLEALSDWHKDHDLQCVVLNCPLIGHTNMASRKQEVFRMVESILDHPSFYVCVL